MDRDLPKARPFWRNPVVLGISIGLAIVVGIPLVISLVALSHGGPQKRAPEAGDIAQRWREDLGLVLPEGSSLAQTHQISAGVDAAAVWELNIPAGAMPGFIEQLETAARAKGWALSPSTSVAPFVPDAPAWWTPEPAGVSRWISLRNGEQHMTYYVGYSLTSSRCFVYWMTF